MKRQLSGRDPNAADSRSEPRMKVFRIGCAKAGGVQFKVHLLDVSPRGARLHGGQLPGPGARMTLACSTITTTAEVRWVDASRFGVRFDVPLIPAELEVIAGPA
jgi:hypothetical protein